MSEIVLRVEYRYRGFTFARTDVKCGNNGRYLYNIHGLKSEYERPFLTSIRECEEYIDYILYCHEQMVHAKRISKAELERERLLSGE